MNFINGAYKVLSIKYNDVYLPIGCLTENSFEESSDMIDTTTRDNENGWKSSKPVNQQFSISFSGLISDADENVVSFYDIKNLKRNRTLINWRIDDGTNTEYGQGYISTINDTASIDEYVSFSAVIVGYGMPGIGTGSLNEILNTEL